MLYTFMDLDIKLYIVVSTWREVEHCTFCCSRSGSASIPPPYEAEKLLGGSAHPEKRFSW